MVSRLGQLGEDLATDYLSARGYKIVARNYRSRLGEIDIIALHREAVVFVEVKARSSDRFGTPAEAITRSKLNKLKLLIGDFVKLYNLSGPVRFEVVVISKNQPPQLITDIEFVDN